MSSVTKKSGSLSLSSMGKKAHICCQEGNLTILKSLLDEVPEILEGCNAAGTTLLGTAIKFLHIKIVKFLLERGANVHVSNNAGQTSLQIACWKNLSDVANMLLVAGANPNSQDLRGWTPLMIAAQQGNEDLVRILLQNKASISLTDKYGKRAIDRANSQNVFLLLQSASIDLHIDTSRKVSPDRTLTQFDSPRSLNKDCTKTTESFKFSIDKTNRYKNIFTYYRKKMAEQIEKLGTHLSRKSAEQLNDLMQEEFQKSESFLRGVIGNELSILSDQVKEQLDAHISDKIREMSEVMKLSTEPLTLLKEEASDVQPHFATTSTQPWPAFQLYKQGRSSRTLGLESNEDISPIVREPSVGLNRDEKEVFSQLKRDLFTFLGSRIDEMTAQLSLSNQALVSKFLDERMNKVEKEMRKELKNCISTLTSELGKRIEKLIEKQKIKRTSPPSKSTRCKTPSKSSSIQKASENTSKPAQYLQLTELSSMIGQLDKNINSMMDQEKCHIRSRSGAFVKTSVPKIPSKEPSTPSSPRFAVNYLNVRRHNPQVIPSACQSPHEQRLSQPLFPTQHIVDDKLSELLNKNTTISRHSPSTPFQS